MNWFWSLFKKKAPPAPQVPLGFLRLYRETCTVDLPIHSLEIRERGLIAQVTFTEATSFYALDLLDQQRCKLLQQDFINTFNVISGDTFVAKFLLWD